jgi:hypothetical protein
MALLVSIIAEAEAPLSMIVETASAWVAMIVSNAAIAIACKLISTFQETPRRDMTGEGLDFTSCD